MDLSDIKKLLEDQQKAFEEFKGANDERIQQIETKGAADATTVAKVEKIEGELKRFEDVNQKITNAEQAQKAAQEAADEETKKLHEQIDEIETKLGRASVFGGLGSKEEREAERKARANLWLRSSVNALTMGKANLGDEERKALDDAATEWKALNVSNDTAGGYLAPIEYVREILKDVVEVSPARGLVRVRQTAQKSIQVPKRTGVFSAQWVAEQGTKSETTGLAYGLEEIPTHELYALVDISNQQLEDSAFDMEEELRMEAAEQFAVAEGTAVVTGSGVGRPQGWNTNGDVAETVSGSAAALTADGLIDLYHAIKTAYARNATWALNRSTLGAVRKLKDSQNQYLWQPGIAGLRPSTILDAPYVEMPDMPNVGANAYPIAFGDFRRAYTLVDRISMEMLRDPFTQATSGNVRFIFRRRLGGQVVLAEAIRKQKVST